MALRAYLHEKYITDDLCRRLNHRAKTAKRHIEFMRKADFVLDEEGKFVCVIEAQSKPELNQMMDELKDVIGEENVLENEKLLKELAELQNQDGEII